MSHVLTVIGAPGTSTLAPALIQAALGALAEAGARPGEPDWLAPAEACDIPFAGAAPERAEAAVRARLGDAPVDLHAQPAAGRRKALLVADMESTIIAEELLDILGDMAGIGPRIAAVTARAMAGELDFAAALTARVRLLAGQPASLLDAVRARITLNPGARTLVATMGAHGAHTALVSGGFTCFTEPVRAACGFDEAHGNRLLVANGALSGEVGKPILDRTAKETLLGTLAEPAAGGPAAACAVGDGANDAAMVAAAGLGVAYRAKPVLRGAARVCIDHGDLTALLYLQGYRRRAFTD